MSAFKAHWQAKIAAATAAVLITGGIAYATWQTSAAASPATVASSLRVDSGNVSTIERTFSKAISAVESFGTPSASYEHQALTVAGVRHAAPVFPAAMLRQLRASGQAALALYFSTAQAKVERRALDGALALDANPHIINLGSGVSNVRFLSVAVSADTATVEAQVTVWAKSKVQQLTGKPWLTAAPVNRVNYTATMRLSTAGTWHITGLAGSFVPGYGP